MNETIWKPTTRSSLGELEKKFGTVTTKCNRLNKMNLCCRQKMLHFVLWIFDSISVSLQPANVSTFSKANSVQVGWEGVDAALCDLRVLVLVLADAVEVLDVAGTSQQLHKVLVVGDDQQLEVSLARAALDDSDGREYKTRIVHHEVCEIRQFSAKCHHYNRGMTHNIMTMFTEIQSF